MSESTQNNPKRIFVDQNRCLGCKTCELRCAVERGSESKKIEDAVNESILPRSKVYVEWDGQYSAPIQCRHCEDAPCLEICSTGAMQRDKETGCTYVDSNKCLACWMCIMVCPYGVIGPAAEKGAADKCDQCFQMQEPHCVAACPTKALQVVSANEFNRQLKARREQGLAKIQYR